MAIKLNWELLHKVHKELKDNGYKDNTKVIFTLFFINSTPRKVDVPFSEFLQVFWKLSDTDSSKITSLVVQNTDGAVLYRHKRLNKGNEEIPNGGNTDVILNWNGLKENEKSMYMNMLIASINAYDK